MSGRGLLACLALTCACGPAALPSLPESEEGATGEPAESDASSTGAVDGTDEGDASSGEPEPEPEPEPLPCINIEPEEGDVCYVEHLLSVSTWTMALSDQDADGHPDLVAAIRDFEAHADSLWLLRGTADGLFEQPELLFDEPGDFQWLRPMGPGPDGIPRVLAQRSVDLGFMGDIVYGTLAGETFVHGPPLPFFHRSEVAVVDLDGDGVLDFTGFDRDAYFGTSGPMGSFEIIAHPMGTSSSVAMLAGDEDGDGRGDLLLLAGDEGDVDGIWQNRVFGHWSHTMPGPVPSGVPDEDEWTMLVATDPSLASARLTDLDGDGRLDLWASNAQYVPATGNRFRDRILVALGTEDGFASQIETDLDTNIELMEPMEAAGDGALRAVVQTEDAPSELWLMQMSEAHEFEVRVRLQLSHENTIFGSHPVEVADLNGDGNSDFVTTVVSADEERRIAVVLSQP